jgi:hypothetical protein
LQIGNVNVSTADHSANPTVLFEVSYHVERRTQLTGCIGVNSRHVIIDIVLQGIYPSVVPLTPALLRAGSGRKVRVSESESKFK